MIHEDGEASNEMGAMKSCLLPLHLLYIRGQIS